LKVGWKIEAKARIANIEKLGLSKKNLKVAGST